LGHIWADRQVFLFCNDVETGAGAPPLEIVESALEYFDKCQSAEGVIRVLVQCRRGKSRSTALGLVLLRRHHGSGTEQQCLDELLKIRPLAAPNIAIVRHGDHILGCKGKLVAVVENDAELSRRRAEASVVRAPVSALIAWHTGFADQARALIQESLSAAERLNKFGHVAVALTNACLLYRELRETQLVRDSAQRLMTSASDHPWLQVLGSVYSAWALSRLGQMGEAIPMIRAGLDELMSRGAGTMVLTALGEAQAQAGEPIEAIAAFEEALDRAPKSAIEIEFILWRRAQVYLQCGDLIKAERDFAETLKVARRVGSQAYELRAVTGLNKVAKATLEEARAMLAEVWNRFTEGFDTADLKDAKALLMEV